LFFCAIIVKITN